MNKYTVVLTREEDGRFSASVPALPGCHTWGDSFDHAVEMAHEAIGLYLEELRANHQQAPSDEAVVVTTIEIA